MKNLILIFFTIVSFLGVGQGTLIYTQDFSSSVPTGWTVVNAGTGNNWSTTYLSSSLAYNGSYSMRYYRNTSNAANTWAFTQGVSMVSGRKYRVEFYQKVGNSIYTERLRVTVGNAQTVASQTTTLLTLSSLNNTTYTERVTSEYTCPSTGTYHFAFNCYSVSNQFELAVDNVRIYETNVALPVEILIFDGKNKGNNNYFFWVTASEDNTSHFDLEKSKDGKNWDKVFTKNASYKSTKKIKYDVTDYNVDPIINYYRLQQYDLDGVYETFGPISIDNRMVEKLVVKYINLIGQEINPNNIDVMTVYIEIYSDGTSRKVIK